MLKYILKRILLVIPVLLIVSLVIMFLLDCSPGDPVDLIAGFDATPEEKEAIREELGYNDPFFVRYFRYINNVLHGDWGTSIRTGRPVIDDILSRFPYSLKLSALSVIFAALIGIPIGIYAATHQYTWKDNASMFVALFAVSMPGFWFALMLVRVFSVKLGWFEMSYTGASWTEWVLPVIANCLSLAATVARQMRSNLLEVIRQDYITTARSKGLPEFKVIYKHGLKNASIPIVQVLGTMFGTALSGAMITETIFSLPGLGTYTLTGLNNRDYPVIQSSVLFFSAVFCIVILLIDIAFAFIDPRIKSQFYGSKKKKKNAAASNLALASASDTAVSNVAEVEMNGSQEKDKEAD